jgi:sulfotransferase family protein
MTKMAAPDGTAAAPAPAPGTIAGRLFVVGCARSGTTLLQSFLAAHPWVLSFPETQVFGRLFYNEGSAPPRSAPGSHRPESSYRTKTQHRRTQLAYRYAVGFLDMIGRRDLEVLLPMRSRSLAEFAAGFVAVLDRLALDRSKSFWLEKTPENVHYVAEMLELMPDAKFINILRDGRQNVAALYDMARKYPDRWWVRYRDLDESIEHWNVGARSTRKLLGRPEVMLVRQEALRADPERVLREVCRFAGLPFATEMIERRVEAARAIVTEREGWKADVLGEVRLAIEDRFSEVFDAEQRAYVEARLERVDF